MCLALWVLSLYPSHFLFSVLSSSPSLNVNLNFPPPRVSASRALTPNLFWL